MSLRVEAWTTKRPIIRTKLNNQKLSLTAFGSIDTEIPRACHFADKQNITFDFFGSTDWLDFTSALTIEAWIKIPVMARFTADLCGIFTRQITGAGPLVQYGMYYNCTNSKLVFRYTKGAAQTTVTFEGQIPTNQWCHVAVTWDGTTIKGYINTVLSSTTAALVPNLDAYVNGGIFLGIGPSADPLGGFMDEIRVWSVARTQDELIASYNTPRDVDQLIDVDLQGYFKFDEVTGALVTPNSITGNNYTIATTQIDDDGAPLILGASHILALYSCEIERVGSLVFPVVPPEDFNFGLFVSWIDSDDNVQRRKLFDPGCDINPSPAAYAGEVLPVSFTLEVWNIDGEPTVDLEDDLEITLSLLDQPTSQWNHDGTETAITHNSDIYENFPLVFPMLFNQPRS